MAIFLLVGVLNGSVKLMLVLFDTAVQNTEDRLFFAEGRRQCKALQMIGPKVAQTRSSS